MDHAFLSSEERRRILDALEVHRGPPFADWDTIFRPMSPYLYLQRSGSRPIGKGGASFAVKPGDVVFFLPGSAYTTPRPTTPYSAWALYFSGSKGDRWAPKPPPSSSPSLFIPFLTHGRGHPERPLWAEELVRRTQSRTPGEWLKAEALLARFLAELSTEATTPPPLSHFEHVFAQILSAPWERPGEADLARRARMSLATFKRHFQSRTGTNLRAYRHALIMAEAARCLLAPEPQTLEQLASEFGYFDAFHFSKAFKKALGLSPRAFRASRR